MALMTFQRAYGLFPRMLGKGDAAQVGPNPFESETPIQMDPLSLESELLLLRGSSRCWSGTGNQDPTSTRPSNLHSRWMG